YNASPDSMKASIGVLSSISCTGKRIAVLADMLELGEHSEEAHQRVGKMVAQSNADLLYCYGEQSRYIMQAAQKCGMQEVYWFDNKSRMAREIRKNIETGDCVLFKGSRGMRLEEVIYQIYRES
ncbi:MAG: cyanophycin synthetase, partial [Clostridiales bacterium]|nr:cyanophycin synthetase [Clostridiales bacterium]